MFPSLSALASLVRMDCLLPPLRRWVVWLLPDRVCIHIAMRSRGSLMCFPLNRIIQLTLVLAMSSAGPLLGPGIGTTSGGASAPVDLSPFLRLEKNPRMRKSLNTFSAFLGAFPLRLVLNVVAFILLLRSMENAYHEIRKL